MLKTIKNYNFAQKIVLLRCDFNAPIRKRKVLDNFKIQRALPTINYLQESGAKIVLLSHLGRPKGRRELSLKPIGKEISKLLGCEVEFCNKVIGRKVRRKVSKIKPKGILLLENLRFHKGELKNSIKFARVLADLGDVYVSEAFSVCHRRHASIARLPKLMPHFVGLGFAREIEVLSKVVQNPERPFCVIIGGQKAPSKIGILHNFLKNTDHILLGGKTANLILAVKGQAVNQPWPSDEVVFQLKRFDLTSNKLQLPFDVVVSTDSRDSGQARQTGPANVRQEERIFDIGEDTISTYKAIIAQSKTILWAGALGLVENEKFSHGTEQIAKAITRNTSALKIVGGGDTVAFLRKHGLTSGFSYLSTGGGAMLAFLAGSPLPGLRALQ